VIIFCAHADHALGIGMPTLSVHAMAKRYQPPYTITSAIIRLISNISEQLGRLSVQADDNNLRLRRINRIRTIQGSLAIEGNTLSEAQITAILDGKRVMAPPKDIQEARNAIKAYNSSKVGSRLTKNTCCRRIRC
jgi:Fic family protein